MGGILDNLTNAINTWNQKMTEIWLLLTQTPQTFKGGHIWTVIVKIHNALTAIGLALLVLCGWNGQNVYKSDRNKTT